MRGALPRRSGYAVVPQLELGVGRLAIALRGKGSRCAGQRHYPIRFEHRDPAAIGLPRTEESRPTRRDGCLAREMRKPHHATRTAAGALLRFWGLRLLVRHERDHQDVVPALRLPG
jgi:hypothetical protein